MDTELSSGDTTRLQTKMIHFTLGPKVNPVVFTTGRWDCWHKWCIHGWSCGSLAEWKQFQVPPLGSELVTLVYYGIEVRQLVLRYSDFILKTACWQFFMNHFILWFFFCSFYFQSQKQFWKTIYKKMSLIKSYLKKSMPVCHINPVRVLFGIKEVRTGFLGKCSSSLNVLYIFCC